MGILLDPQNISMAGKMAAERLLAGAPRIEKRSSGMGNREHGPETREESVMRWISNYAARKGFIPMKLATFFLLALFVAAQPVEGQTSAGATGPVIDNERVTVWDIVLTPGQPTSFRRHELDFVTLFLVGGKIRTTEASGKTSVAERSFGDAVYGRKGTEEKEEVVSEGPARLIVVELKDHPVPPLVNRSGYPAAFPRPGSKNVLDNERVAVWNYSWTPGVATPVHYHDKDIVVVFRFDGSLKSTTTDGKSVVNDYQSGSIRFNKGDRVHSETLVSGQQSAMMVELK